MMLKSKSDKPISVQKLERKLTKVHDLKEKTPSRMKALMSFVEKAPEPDVQKLFSTSFSVIWQLFLDNLSNYESSTKQKDRNKQNYKELVAALQPMKLLLMYIPDQIKKKWQIRSFANILERLLVKENALVIRKVGYELMLKFLEDLENGDPPYLQYIATGVDLTPLITLQHSSVVLPYKSLSAQDPNTILAPSFSSNTVPETIELLEIYFEFMNQHSKNFDYWFKLFKNFFLKVFYPAACKEMGLLENLDDSGFTAYCPHEIQAILVDRLCQWLEKKEISDIFWLNQENVILVLEIYRQSSSLPITFVEAIKKSVGLFFRIFFVQKPKVVEPKLVSYQIFFLKKLTPIFASETPTNMKERHTGLGIEILQHFNVLMETYEKLDPEVREIVLLTLLDITMAVLDKKSRNLELAQELQGPLLEAVLSAWIRSGTRSEKLWNVLENGLCNLFHWQQTVTQIKAKVIQMTYVLQKIIFPHAKVKTEANQVSATAFTKKDPHIQAVNWDLQSGLFFWSSMLGLLKNANSIQDPAIHCEAIACYFDTIQVFLEAEYSSPYEDLEDVRVDSLDLMRIFGKYLFETIQMPEKYSKGKAIAIAALCKLLIHRHKTYPFALLCHIYDAIASGFISAAGAPFISWEILRNSESIFSIGLMGVNILIPYYLLEVKRLLRPGCNPPPPEDVKMKCIAIMSSLICYSYHFEGTDIPMEGGTKVVEIISEKKRNLNYAEVKEQVAGVLINVIDLEKQIDLRVKSLWALSILVYAEAKVTSAPNLELINKAVKCLYGNASNMDYIVAKIALYCLMSLVPILPELGQFDKGMVVRNIVEAVVAGLQATIAQMIQKRSGTTSDMKDTLAPLQYQVLSEYVMAAPNLLDSPSLAKLLFESIALGIFGELGKAKTLPADARKSVKLTDSGGEGSKPLFEFSMKFQTQHGSPTTQEAAIRLLKTLESAYNTFHYLHPPDILDSVVTEADEAKAPGDAIHFTIGHDVVLSVLEVPGTTGDANQVRMLARTQSGKFMWNFKMEKSFSSETPILSNVHLYSKNENSLQNSNSQQIPKRRANALNAAVPATNNVKLNPYKRDPGKIPEYIDSDNMDESHVDKLGESLKYLSEAFPELLPAKAPTLNRPQPPSQMEFMVSIKDHQDALSCQLKEDAQAIDLFTKEKPGKEAVPELTKPVGAYHLTRQLLTHMEFLGVESREHIRNISAANQMKFQRNINQLDTLLGREGIKVGLIYVGLGQEYQKQLFENTKGSPLFREFTSSLGWQVDMRSHRGYFGGLEKGANEAYPYFANSNVEIIYHDVTALPKPPDDVQFVKKKRHVGNDHVHIIWSEHSRDYDPGTITSQFNDAHVIIYPLANGLFRIQCVKKDPNLPWFGPLVDGSVVSKAILGPLVRQTATIAHIFVREKMNDAMIKPPFLRDQLVQDIVEKCVEDGTNYLPFVANVLESEPKPKPKSVVTKVTIEPKKP